MPIHEPLVLVVGVALGLTLFSSLGVVVGIYAKTWDHAGFVQNILIVPLSFLGGVFYSVSTLPSPWREVSHANPIFYLVQAVRYGFLGTSDVPVGHRAGHHRGAGRAHRGLERLAVSQRAQAQALTRRPQRRELGTIRRILLRCMSDRMTDRPSMNEVLLARQPILNGDLVAVGYELLYRETRSDHANVRDDELATARVSLRAMTEIDLELLVDQRRAWINVTREFVLGGFAQTIPPDRVVLELLEDQLVDKTLIDAVSELRADGYLVALDDFTLTPDIEPLLPKVDIVKLDLRALGAEGFTRLAHDLSRHRLTLVGEKLEDHADFEVAVAAGCHLFQGYFFCRPELIEGTSVAPNQLALLKLAADVQDPAVDLATLDRVISTDVALSYRLLRYINSAYFSVRTPVSTVMQAVTLLGIDNVRNWTTMMILAQIGGKPQELFVTALVRARFCQLAGRDEDGPSSELFALGLFSVVDALTDSPMATVVSALPFPEAMRQALVNRSGAGRLLDCVEAMEVGEFTRARRLVRGASEHYLEALAWTNETAHLVLDGDAAGG